jgi:hypothetical protein
MITLGAQLLAAHDKNDAAALVSLYTQAADQSDDVDATCFYLTHAYVYALELGSYKAVNLRDRLVTHGREPSAN